MRNLLVKSPFVIVVYCVLISFNTLSFKAYGFKSLSESINGGGLLFWENQGQYLDHHGNTEGVLFCAYAPRADVYLTTEGINFVFKKQDSNPFADPDFVELTNFRVKLKGANIALSNVEKYEKGNGYMNFHYPHCPKGGVEGVAGYGNVKIKDVYPGIDWVIYGDKANKGITHDFIVHPGANPEMIQLEYDGAAALQASFNTNILYIQNRFGELVEEGKLVVYQGNEKQEIPSSYKVNGNEVSYNVGTYDKSKDLIIDPYFWLDWGTYWTGSAADIGADLHFDNTGAFFYVCGRTTSTKASFVDLRGTVGLSAASPANAGDADGFLLKFDTNAVLQWGTLFGGSNLEKFGAMAVNSSGQPYIAGYTMSTDIDAVLVSSSNGGSYNDVTYNDGASGADDGDHMLLRFNTAGTILWATIIGGSDQEGESIDRVSGDVCIDASDNVYLSGTTESRSTTGFTLTGAPSIDLNTDRSSTDGARTQLYHFKFNSSDVVQWSAHHNNGYEHFQVNNAFNEARGTLVVVSKMSTSGTGVLKFDSLHPGGAAFTSSYTAGGANALALFEIDADGDSVYWATSTPGTGDIWLGTVNHLAITDNGGIHVAMGGYNANMDASYVDNIGSNVHHATGGGGSESIYMRFGSNRSLELLTSLMGRSGDDALNYIETQGDTVIFGIAGANSAYPVLDAYGSNMYYAARQSVNGASYMMKLDQNADLLYGSYLDGNSHDMIKAIAVNPVYDYQTVVMGWSWGTGYERWMDAPSSPTAYIDTTSNGGLDQVYLYMLKPYEIIILPIELLSIEAEVFGNDAVVRWVTASELNNDYFIVERSFDGIHYMQMGKVAGSGTVNAITEYEYTDLSVNEQSCYYRIKQFDYDGQSSYSEAVFVTFERKSFKVYPTLTHEKLNVEFSDEVINGKMNIYNNSNVLVDQLSIPVHELNVAHYPNGVYWIRLENDATAEVQRFIKN